ncbi:hypothetical protein BDD12DRAFT_873054 [Trichophaea hybrida]|nr:hypothetical protein BDD12DRAFT_873054 [Trichophaea hybrida]
MQENHNTRQRSSSSSYYSSSPSEDYISDIECEYNPPLPGSDDPPLYPIRVNRTVAITVEVSPRSSISMETDPSRIRTYCYSSSPSILDWEERRHTGGGRTIAVQAPVSAVGSPSSKSHYAYEIPRNDPTARYVASADDASTKTATVVLPLYSDYYRLPGTYAQLTPRISGATSHHRNQYFQIHVMRILNSTLLLRHHPVALLVRDTNGVIQAQDQMRRNDGDNEVVGTWRKK